MSKINLDQLLDSDRLTPAQERLVRKQLHSKSIEKNELSPSSASCLIFKYSIENVKKKDIRDYSLNFDTLEELKSDIYKYILKDLISTKVSYLKCNDSRTIVQTILDQRVRDHKNMPNFRSFGVIDFYKSLEWRQASCYHSQSLFKALEFINAKI